ncbi:MAG: hypothetical protein M0Z56_09515 [Desulfobacteraceae bacterium]|nr:hypothetical protein [Desulfobacteraceae bacterium]
MNLPDEAALKAEIQEIADRIDRIIETVNQHHSLKPDPDTTETPKSDQG